MADRPGCLIIKGGRRGNVVVIGLGGSYLCNHEERTTIDRSNEDRGGEDAAREVFEVCNRARYQIPLYVAREAVALENQIDSKCKVVYYCCFKVVSYMIIL